MRSSVLTAMLVASGACGRIGFDAPAQCWPRQTVEVPFANSQDGATGSAGDPFLICTATQLDAIGRTPAAWASSFLLASDLDLTGRAVPITMIGTDAQPFTGSFDGGGHTITGLAYDAPTLGEVALFASAGVGARLQNVTLHDVDIVGSSAAALLAYGIGVTVDRVHVDGVLVAMGTRATVAGIVGEDDCSVAQGCEVSPSITNSTATVDLQIGSGTFTMAGGILGFTYTDGTAGTGTATLTNLVSAGTITGGNEAGGIVACGEPILLSQSSSSMTITTQGNSVGGLVGDTVYIRSLITDSFATGDITCSNGGGLAGTMEGSIAHSHATGNVTCSSEGGGIVGDISGQISQSWASGTVTGTVAVGGLVGTEYGTGISDSFATGKVQGQTLVGGLVGELIPFGNNNSTALVRCYSTSQVHGSDSVGGLIGQLGETGSTGPASASDAFALGPVTGASGSNNVSLLIGAETGTFSTANLYDASTVTCTNTAGTCTVYGTAEPDAAYFDVPSNPPLASWDFTNVWRAGSNGPPTLR